MFNTKTLDRIRELDKTGKRQKDIAKILTAEGYKTKTGKPFTQAAVSVALTRYLGIRRTKEFTKGKTKKARSYTPSPKVKANLDTILLEIAATKLPDEYKLAFLQAIKDLS